MLSVQSASASWFSQLPSEVPETHIDQWQSEKGDSLLVDTDANIGYLVHANGGFTSFPVVTGQERIVHYIGRTYNAKTPNRRWVSESIQEKGKSVTFGRGTFLRLSYEGEGTPYGIHSHAYADTMLSRQMRYGSMGCIIVSKEILDIIIQTFTLNGHHLDVVTTDGFEDGVANYASLQKQIGPKS